jgi:hypothetical protein
MRAFAPHRGRPTKKTNNQQNNQQLRHVLYLFVGGTTGVLLWKM